jgi:Autotransporter beta-domain
MHPLSRTRGAFVSLIAVVVLVSPAVVTADDGAVQGQMSVYTGENAVGYLQPLVNAFGATLNTGFGYSAYIPPTSFHIGLEFPVMGVFFEDEDKTFMATTEPGFDPTTEMEVPTVVGSGQAVVVPGTGGAQFAFPGGFDLNSFGLVVPQIRLSSLAGLEAVVRWIAYDDADADVGDIDMFGIGGRYGLSQHLGAAPPLDVAVGVLWQSLDVGTNDFGNPFTSTSALSVQLQGSKRMPVGFATFEPYGTVAYENLDVDVQYSDANDQPVDVSLEGENSFRFTIGAGINFVAGQVWADYSFADTSNFSFGLALGNLGR